MSALKLSGAEIRQAFLDFYSLRGTLAVAEWFVGTRRSDGVIDDLIFS